MLGSSIALQGLAGSPLGQMSFIRRGSVSFPHKLDASVILHRLDGTSRKFRLAEINCWEEHQAERFGPVTFVYHFLSSTPVRESFDDLTALIEAKRPVVNNV